jgi:hypothetical protein
MKTKPVRCAIYTRKSTEEGLDKEFTSLDARRESAEAYVKSQAALAGWGAPNSRHPASSSAACRDGIFGTHKGSGRLRTRTLMLWSARLVNLARAFPAMEMPASHDQPCFGISLALVNSLFGPG